MLKLGFTLGLITLLPSCVVIDRAIHRIAGMLLYAVAEAQCKNVKETGRLLETNEIKSRLSSNTLESMATQQLTFVVSPRGQSRFEVDLSAPGFHKAYLCGCCQPDQSPSCDVPPCVKR